MKKKYETFEAKKPYTGSDKNFRFGIHERSVSAKGKPFYTTVYEADFDRESAELACLILNEGGSDRDWSSLRREMEKRGWVDKALGARN